MFRVRLQYTVLGPSYEVTVRRAAVIDCPSETCRQAVLAEANGRPDDIFVIPNGANVAFYRPCDVQQLCSSLGIPRGAQVIGYVGALGGEARFVSLLVDALIALRSDETVFGLIVGDGPERIVFERRVRDAGASERICFPGFVPNREIPEYMSTMDIAADLTAVAFSLNGKTLCASYSQKIAQYLACGVPVLAWDFPDTRFLEENAIGFLASLRDPGHLLRTLNVALKADENERAARKRRAREYAVKYLSYKVLASIRLRLWRAAAGLTAKVRASGESLRDVPAE
jgi:glycosyltransferase involved in cell wall biosynthesis